ncbi:MAG: tryptophan-rich sensory protein [Williamsia sp.]|nr:tryptophan-rich sensory protein [Williamsia sp.]
MAMPKQGRFATAAYKLNWWQIALISMGVSLLGKLSTGGSRKKEQRLYNVQLKQAPWAPPAWLFGVAWPLNNFFVLLALKELLGAEPIPERKKLLIMQGAIWLIFFSFGFVYFRKQSPLLAAAWTMADAGLSIASFLTARRIDKKLAYYYLPLLVWTSYASTVADYQALKNNDPVLKISAPLD